MHQLQLIQLVAAKAVAGKYKNDHMEDDPRRFHGLIKQKRGSQHSGCYGIVSMSLVIHQQ